jgi:hypothetical protein
MVGLIHKQDIFSYYIDDALRIFNLLGKWKDSEFIFCLWGLFSNEPHLVTLSAFSG